MMLFLLTVIFLFQILFLFSVKECTSTPCKRCTRNRKRDQPGLNIAVITGPRPVADYPVDSVIVDDMISVELITGDPCLVIQDTVFRNLINNRFTICRIQVEVFKCTLPAVGAAQNKNLPGRLPVGEKPYRYTERTDPVVVIAVMSHGIGFPFPDILAAYIREPCLLSNGTGSLSRSRQAWADCQRSTSSRRRFLP